MTRATRAIALAAAVIATLASAPARANGASWDEETRGTNARQQGPLTLSADGRWRVHVDGADVMHRVNLADPKQASSVALPLHVHALAASRTGQKVALVTDSGCEALVDFGTGPSPVPRVSWRPAWPLRDIDRQEPAQRGLANQAWLPAPPKACFGGQAPSEVDVIALSTDGRLLASASEVIDLDTHRVVATLARGHEQPVLLRFLAHDTRLLSVDERIAEGDGDSRTRDRLVMALWDLKTGALLSLSDQRRDLELPVTQLADLPAGSTTVYSVSQSPYTAPPDSGREGQAELTGWRVDGCGSPLLPHRLPIEYWTGFAVDPAGRWVAGTRAHFFDSEEAASHSPFVEDLVVLDVATGRTLLVRAWPHALRGLVASLDGTQLFALATAPIDPATGSRKAADPNLPIGQVLTITIPGIAPAATLREAIAPPPCPVAGEGPHARELAHDARALRPLWRQSLADVPGSWFTCTFTCNPLMVMQDGSIWLDRGRTVTQFDNGSGKPLRTLPTPRSDRVTSVAVPAADGWFNAQGDTLSWRLMAGGAARRVVDQRPGFEIVTLRAQANAVLAAWVRKGSVPASVAGPDNPARLTTYVFYDAQGQRVSESTNGTEAVEGEEWPGSEVALDAVSPPNAPTCYDGTGARTAGFDWRLGMYESIVAWSCGPVAGDARMALWSDIDVRAKSDDEAADVRNRQVVAQAGAIAVIQDSLRLRVFDAATRRELGRIAPVTDVRAVAIDARHGQVLVVTATRDPDNGPWHETLQAYALRP